MRSILYSNLVFSRLGMNLLYRGNYRRRFLDIVELMVRDVQTVCEFCFEDTFIADWCRSRGIDWTGVDINSRFCKRAQRKGFNAVEGDVFSVNLEAADVYIMAGSLYHFHNRLSSLFDMILSHTTRFILSEPIQNLSSPRGIVGWLAKRSANPGNGHALFRYNQESLLQAVREEQKRKGFKFQVVSIGRDILLEISR